MSLPRVLAITGRIISQFRHDHRSLALVFVVPVVVMSLLGYVFRAQENSTVNVALVNEDQGVGQTRLSGTIIDGLKSNENLVISELSRSQAEKAVRDGSERVALVFPPGFTQNLMDQHKATVEMIVEGSNPSEANGALAVV